MCDYCSYEENGDVNPKLIIDKEDTYISEIECEQNGTKISVNIKKPIYAHCQILAPHKIMCIGALLYGDVEKPIFEFGEKINYCPMCGRKL